MKHLNGETLNTLKDVMEDDFTLLIDTFIQDSSERICTLQRAIQNNDTDAIRRAAHSFKGSSSNIGAPQLAALCSALEKKVLANNFDGLSDDLYGIEQEFAQVQILLHDL
jgi:HPt (histidine-containing phosphotransfer) domain-containing protein